MRPGWVEWLIIAAILGILIGVAVGAHADEAQQCKYGHGRLTWYGDIRTTETGHLEYLCECVAGDAWWFERMDCSK